MLEKYRVIFTVNNGGIFVKFFNLLELILYNHLNSIFSLITFGYLNLMLLATRSLLFYLGHYSNVVVFSTIGLMLKPLPLEKRINFMRFGVLVSLFWLRLTCNIKHIVHFDNKIDESKASIVLSRHESTWEALAFHSIFPTQINVVKKELSRIPFFGFILIVIESIMIDRNKPFEAIKNVKRAGRNALLNNFWVVIFPGGTRIKPSEKSEVNSGGAILAKQENVPVYLVAHNAGEFWPKGTFIKRPGVINVYVKKINDTQSKDIESINLETKKWLNRAF
ncbi:MAG: lysophospholipid acyltransferase family protein [Pseudomonadota bacterium]|nr:lysophospholipid acyltransferase family protein [Pseudomonadota bacterium]